MKRIVIILIIVLLYVTIGAVYAQTWQEKLEDNFDIVSTFDELQDWTGKADTGDTVEGNWGATMPRLLDGGISKWQYYSEWYGVENHGPWIGDHGAENRWSGTKTLRLNYGADKVTYGPERLGMYFGDGSPTSGYDDIYIFYMLKYSPRFFARIRGDNEKFEAFDYCKTLTVGLGFRDVFDWGTPEQQALCETVQDMGCYGLNSFICNYTSLASTDHNIKLACTNFPPRNATPPLHYVPQWGTIANDVSISDPIKHEEWFGLEYRFYKGVADTAADGMPILSGGKVELWAYNNKGEIIGHDLYEGLNLAKIFVDHKYNRVVFGGNRNWDVSCINIYAKIIYKDTLEGIVDNVEGLWNNLVADGYINENGDIQDAICAQLTSENDLTLDLEFEDKRAEIYDIVWKSYYTADKKGRLMHTPDAYIFLDDVVINGSRIGPTYFKLLKEQQTEKPGDINNDDAVDVLDVQLCVNVILEIETTPDIVNKAKAVAVPIDTDCDVSDLQAVVNAVLGGEG